MSRRTSLKRAPELESFEEKCLLSTASAALPIVTETAVFLPQRVAPALVHGHHSTGMSGPCHPVLKNHRPQSSGFSLVPVSNPLPSPVARVQVDNVGLVSGRTYPTMSVLEVINQTGTAIGRGQFTVNVAGSSFQRAFPAQVWQPGQVQVFFATTSVQNFTFHLAGPVASIPPNVYFNVTYNPSTFTTTLHNLVNSSFGVGGRFALQG